MICLLLNGTSGHANAINQLCECDQSVVVTVNNRVGNFLGHEKRSPVNLIICHGLSRLLSTDLQAVLEGILDRCQCQRLHKLFQ